MKNEPEKTDDQLRREFFEQAANFFSWNSGKNTPNVLIQLERRLASLEKSLKAASLSNRKLGGALNCLTRAYVIVTGLGVLVALVALVRNCWG